MLSGDVSTAHQKSLQKRQLGLVKGDQDGPVVIFLAGVHGNEPAAHEVLQTLFPILEERRQFLHGTVLGLIGNIPALNKGIRFIEQDLNRMWTPEGLNKIRNHQSNGKVPSAEEQQQREIYQTLYPYLEEGNRQVYLIDLHTTSASSAPFIVVGDTLRNRKFAQTFQTPIILGLEERLSGTLLHYAGPVGAISMAFEAGQHDSQIARQHHWAAFWTALVSSGCLKPEKTPEFSQAQDILSDAAQEIPPLFEFTHHHFIQPDEHFEMLPGYVNFERVEKDQKLARNNRGDIKAPLSGYMFMPLYQSKGNDGFFLIKRIQPIWLKVSEWCRRLKMDQLLPHLPGIHPHPTKPSILTIDRRIARGPVLEICHLLGYRRLSEEGRHLLIIKRPFDTSGPHD